MYTIEQIRQAGIDAEISAIDTACLISMLNQDDVGSLPTNLTIYRKARKLDYGQFCEWLNTKLKNKKQ